MISLTTSSGRNSRGSSHHDGKTLLPDDEVFVAVVDEVGQTMALAVVNDPTVRVVVLDTNQLGSHFGERESREHLGRVAFDVQAEKFVRAWVMLQQRGRRHRADLDRPE